MLNSIFLHNIALNFHIKFYGPYAFTISILFKFFHSAFWLDICLNYIVFQNSVNLLHILFASISTYFFFLWSDSISSFNILFWLISFPIIIELKNFERWDHSGRCLDEWLLTNNNKVVPDRTDRPFVN